MSEEHRTVLSSGTGPVHRSVLSDGFLCGTWSVDGGTLTVRHVGRLSLPATRALEAEGLRLLRFLAADAGANTVRFSAVA